MCEIRSRQAFPLSLSFSVYLSISLALSLSLYFSLSFSLRNFKDNTNHTFIRCLRMLSLV